MYTVARYDSATKAKQPNAMQRIYDSAADHSRYVTPDLSKFTAQAEVYVSSPWVNIAIGLIAETAALVNMIVYKLNGDDKKQIDNHPFNQLLRHPNDYSSQFELIYQLITMRRLTGNAYIYLVSGKGGAPDEAHLLRPDCVKIVPGTGGKRVNGYVYQISASTDPIPLEPEQVIHWKRWHPLDPYYGLSDVQVIALSVQADKGMSTWQAKFFSKENAVPAGIVSFPSTVNSTDFEELKSNWYRNYGGTQRATAIIRGDDVKYAPVGTSHVDMDFANGRLFEKEVILNKFGVPLSIFAVNANEANARAGLELLTSNVVWPEMNELCQKFTAELLPFWNDGLVVEPEDIRVKDEKAELQKLQAYAPYKSINEVRADLGFNDVPWGDKPAAGSAAGPGVQAFGKPGQMDQTPQQIDKQESSDAAKALLILTAPVTPPQPVVLTGSAERELLRFGTFAKKRLWRGALKATEVDGFKFNDTPLVFQILARSYGDTAMSADELGAMIDHLCNVAVKAITPAAERVSSRGKMDPLAKEKTVYAGKVSATMIQYLTGLKSRLIDHGDHEPSSGFWNGEQQTVQHTMTPTLKTGLLAMVGSLVSLLSMQQGVSVDTPGLNTDVEGESADWGARMPAQITATTRSGVQAIYQRWRDMGGSSADLKQALDENYWLSDARADMIGETEATGAGAVATRITAQDAAKSLDVDWLNDDISGPPAHGRCRCFETVKVVLNDDGDPIGVDRVWHTVRDDHVCDVCDPLDGLTFSEIAQQGAPVYA